MPSTVAIRTPTVLTNTRRVAVPANLPDTTMPATVRTRLARTIRTTVITGAALLAGPAHTAMLARLTHAVVITRAAMPAGIAVVAGVALPAMITAVAMPAGLTRGAALTGVAMLT